MTNTPLDPNPFASEFVRVSSDNLYPLHYFGYPSRGRSPIVEIVDASVALVAYIPPGALSGKYRAFRDDRVDSQPEWLSEAFVRNKYRLACGLRLQVPAREQMHFWSARSTILAKANPTRFRGVPLLRFAAPVEYAEGTVLVEPPTRACDEVIMANVHVRSKNGLMSNFVGRQAAWFEGFTPAEIPQIGASFQVWVADDGCKCVAAVHNFFPEYFLYIDGVRFSWKEQRDFEEFDAYNVTPEWRVFLAFALHDSLQRFELFNRYPGTFTGAWYRGVDSSGVVEWCEGHAKALFVSYTPPPSRAYIIEWWRGLDDLVSRLRSMKRELLSQEDRERRQVRWPENLDNLWRKIVSGAKGFVRRGTA